MSGRDEGGDPDDAKSTKTGSTTPSKIRRTILELVDALDDHLYLLGDHLGKFRGGEPAHIRSIAGELRALVCKSSNTDGLIWRLAEDLVVPDQVALDLPPTMNSMASDVKFSYIPLIRSTPGAAPKLDFLITGEYSLEALVKKRPAVFLRGGSPRSFDQVIKFASQETGVAHESDTVRRDHAELRSYFVGRTGIRDRILCDVADLALEVGGRVLDKAAHSLAYRRKPRAGAMPGDLR